MLIAARSSQDFACCARATVSARSKYTSAFAVSGCGDIIAISPAGAMHVGLEPLFLSCFNCRHRLTNALPRLIRTAQALQVGWLKATVEPEQTALFQ